MIKIFILFSASFCENGSIFSKRCRRAPQNAHCSPESRFVWQQPRSAHPEHPPQHPPLLRRLTIITTTAMTSAANIPNTIQSAGLIFLPSFISSSSDEMPFSQLIDCQSDKSPLQPNTPHRSDKQRLKLPCDKSRVPASSPQTPQYKAYIKS